MDTQSFRSWLLERHPAEYEQAITLFNTEKSLLNYLVTVFGVEYSRDIAERGE